MTNTVLPIRQDISTQEVWVGASSNTGLSKESVKKAEAFVRAHRQNRSQSGEVAAEVSQQRSTATTQVDAREQAEAVARRGRTDETEGNPGGLKSRVLYKKLISTDERYLQRDLDSLLNALRSQSKSLVDGANGLTPDQKVIRKYLLCEIGLADSGVDLSGRALLRQLKSQLLNSNGELIKRGLMYVNEASELGFRPVQLRELVKAFRSLEADSEGTFTSLMELFKMVRGCPDAKTFIAELGRLRATLDVVIDKEKTLGSRSSNNPRISHLETRAHQIGLLIRLRKLHERFLTVCTNAQFTSLPSASDLIMGCLNLVSSGQPMEATNQVVKMAAGVKGAGLHVRNSFITNYGLLVLNHDMVVELFRNGLHKQQVVDVLLRNVRAAGILSAGGSGVG